MKLTTANFQKTYNLGNYEMMRIGCEFSLEGEKPETIAEAAKAELDRLFKQMMSTAPAVAVEEPKTEPVEEPKAEPSPTAGAENARKIVHKQDKTWKAITKRIKECHAAGTPVTMETIDKYYEFENAADRNVISLMIQLGAE